MTRILKRLDKATNGKAERTLPSVEAMKKLRERLKDKNNKIMGVMVHPGTVAILEILSEKLGVPKRTIVEALLLKAFRDIRDSVGEIDLEFYEEKFGIKSLLKDVEDIIDSL